jgi:hypothetical protein
MNNKNGTISLNVKIEEQSNLPTHVNAFIRTHNVVQKNRRKKQPLLTSLQTELLYLYDQEPTEKQRKQLEVFLFYLLVDDNYSFKSQQEVDAYTALPKKKLSVKREELTPFQNKLLNVYDHEPTALQMQKLQDFLFKLFNNLVNQFDVKNQAEMVA